MATSRPNINRQVVLASRPEALPTAENFNLVEAPVPVPGDGEVLVRAKYLSLDPYMRGRMRDAKSYAPPLAINEVMTGGVVGEVVQSNDAALAPGDLVEGVLGWQDYAAAKAKHLRKVGNVEPASLALGVLGMPGLTAYFGLLDLCNPQEGETVVVSAAAGAVGAVVGQIAKIKGCRAVGIAGSDAKVDYIVNELGFDAGINYKTAERMTRANNRFNSTWFSWVGGIAGGDVIATISKGIIDPSEITDADTFMWAMAAALLAAAARAASATASARASVSSMA